MNGFVIIDKPCGITSSACVYKLRKIITDKKIGHCGTLDPLASGLLPISIGEATKFSSYISDLSKEYKVEVLFGVKTTTGDIDGEIIKRNQINFSKEELKQALNSLIGEQHQLPPMYSALKAMGRPLYSWVRNGVYLQRKARKVFIDSIQLECFSESSGILVVSCSKGTYIRSLVESLGDLLGTGATVKALRRTKIGNLSSHDLLNFDLVTTETLNQFLIPSEEMLQHLTKVDLNAEDIKKIRNGLSVDYNEPLEKKEIIRIYEEKGSFVGIGQVNIPLKVSPKRLLNTRNT